MESVFDDYGDNDYEYDIIKKCLKFTTDICIPNYHDGKIKCECYLSTNDTLTKMVWRCMADDVCVTDFYKCIVTFSHDNIICCRTEDYEEIPLDDVMIYHKNFVLIKFDITDCELSKNQLPKNEHEVYGHFLKNIEAICDVVKKILYDTH